MSTDTIFSLVMLLAIGACYVCMTGQRNVIRRQTRELSALRELCAAVMTQREMYFETSDEDNMGGKQITMALEKVHAAMKDQPA